LTDPFCGVESSVAARSGAGGAAASGDGPVRFYRRYRMEIRVSEVPLPAPILPPGYRFLRWRSDLLDRHAAIKYEAFRGELDSTVFPCLGDLPACRRLMADIASQTAFVPEATWLVTRRSLPDDLYADCGTIQGLAASNSLGAIQNVGVAPEARGLGLGRALVLKALHGFRGAGMRRVYLEVTVENTAAVELYRSVGFRVIRTMYKAGAGTPVGAV
jgi:GNAT superfamily N-acetyltransferase